MCLLFPTPMTRVVIASPRSLQRQAIDALYEQRALHIVDYAPPEGELLFKIGTPLEGADRASGLLIKLRSFKTALGLERVSPTAELPRAEDVLPKIEASVVALEMSITSAARRMPLSSSSDVTSRENVCNIVVGRLSTQK